MGKQHIIACIFCTPDYKKAADNLQVSLGRFGIKNFLRIASDHGSKSEAILECMNKYPGMSVLYLDADSEVVSDPTQKLKSIKTDIAIRLEERKRQHLVVPSRIIFFRNTVRTRQFVQTWIDRSKDRSKDTFGAALTACPGITVTLLPSEYVGGGPGGPVIAHHKTHKVTTPVRNSVIAGGAIAALIAAVIVFI